MLVFLFSLIQLDAAGSLILGGLSQLISEPPQTREQVFYTLLERCFDQSTWEDHGPPRKDSLNLKVLDEADPSGWYVLDISFEVAKKQDEPKCFIEMDLNRQNRKGDVIARLQESDAAVHPAGSRDMTHVQIVIVNQGGVFGTKYWNLNLCTNGLFGTDPIYSLIHDGVFYHREWSGDDVSTNVPEPGTYRPGEIYYRIHRNSLVNNFIDLAERVEDSCAISTELAASTAEQISYFRRRVYLFAAICILTTLILFKFTTRDKPHDHDIYSEI